MNAEVGVDTQKQTQKVLLPKPPLVQVSWKDSCTFNGWRALDDIDGLMECMSVGYMVDKNDDYIAIAQSIAHQGDVGEITLIPVAVISELREL